MGRHSAARGLAPRNIDRLEPVSESGETLREAQQRQKDLKRTPAEMARRRERRGKILFGCLAVFVILLLVGAAAAFAYYQSVNHEVLAKGEAQNPGIHKQLQPRKPGDPFYMLLLGEDKRPGEVRARSDTIIVAYVNPPVKRVTLMSIPRDTRVKIPGYSGQQKINAAMQLGGASLVIETVKDLTGLQINHYMEVDFNGFKDLVDAIGGVYVDVPRPINDGKAANHDFHAEKIPVGYQHLDGAHALTFVRSRKFADADLTRIKDQQVFLKALAKQTLQLSNVVNINKIVGAVVNNTTTDLSVPEMLNLAVDFRGAGNGSVQGVTIPNTPKYIGGVSYVIADRPALAELVQRLEAGESLESTPGSAPKVAVVKPAQVTIAVRNGAGTAGLAAEVANQLKKDAFKVPEVGNTARPVYDSTLIVFKTNAGKAQLVANTLGFGKIVQTATLYQFKTDVLVIVGKDWRKQFPKGTAGN